MLSSPQPLTAPCALETHDGLPLVAKVTHPATPGPWPVLVFVGGSGVWDSDYAARGPDGKVRPLFAVAELADRLAEAGFATVRYQKRGVMDPGGVATPAWRTATVRNLIEDARTVVKWTRADARFDASRLSVVAHSEGTMVATWAAGSDPGVRALVFLGMGYRNAFDIVRRQRPEVSLAALLDRIAAGAPEDLVLGFPVQWWREHQTQTSMAEAWAGLTKPVLIQHGDLDTMAPVDSEALPFAAQLEAQGHPDFKLVRYSELDHFFKDAAGTFQLEALSHDLATWLRPRM
jgi:pimeloyl-ACP methyl ester carboxylesterase